MIPSESVIHDKMELVGSNDFRFCGTMTFSAGGCLPAEKFLSRLRYCPGGRDEQCRYIENE
jgi:hypothetical protein